MDRTELEKKFGISGEELEKSAQAYESGDWPEGKTIRVGRPSIYNDDQLESVTFRLPRSRIRAIDEILVQKGETRSEFLREAVDKAIALTT